MPPEHRPLPCQCQLDTRPMLACRPPAYQLPTPTCQHSPGVLSTCASAHPPSNWRWLADQLPMPLVNAYPASCQQHADIGMFAGNAPRVVLAQAADAWPYTAPPAGVIVDRKLNIRNLASPNASISQLPLAAKIDMMLPARHGATAMSLTSTGVVLVMLAN